MRTNISWILMKRILSNNNSKNSPSFQTQRLLLTIDNLLIEPVFTQRKNLMMEV
jgi:hypothetical protein